MSTARGLVNAVIAQGALGASARDRVAIEWRTADGCGIADTLTYGELHDRVSAVAEGLKRLGMEPGDRCLFSVRPQPEGIVLALATVHAGGTLVFVDLGQSEELFRARVRDAAPKFAFTEAIIHAANTRAGKIVARRGGLRLPRAEGIAVQVYAGRWLPGVPRGAVPLRRLGKGGGLDTRPGGATRPTGDGGRVAGASERIEAAAASDLDALVVFTSGTTSEPKGVVHTQGSLLAGARMLAAAMGDSVAHVHTDQMLLGIPALVSGGTWSMPQQPPAKDPAAFLRGCRGATYLVPADATRILDLVEAGQGELAATRILVGGAPVTPALCERALRLAHDAEWTIVYGMTEALPVSTVDARTKAVWPGPGDLVGQPLAGMRVRVKPGVSADEPGELVLAGPSVMRGYLRDLNHGRGDDSVEHFSGDLAAIREEGIVLLGRSREMIIRGTTNIYPALFEPAIAALPGVAAAAMVGVAQADGDERVALFVVPEPDAGTDESSRIHTGGAPVTGARSQRANALAALLDDQQPTVMNLDALPDLVIVVDELPVAGRSQKLDRDALRRIAAARLRNGASAESADGRIIDDWTPR